MESEQSVFWRGSFGDAYAERNADEALVRSNLALFASALRRAPGCRSLVELGCNVGLNLKALHRLDPGLRLAAYEINAGAAAAAQGLGLAEIRVGSVAQEGLSQGGRFDLAFTKGVLIHIGPDELHAVYRNLVDLSNRYVLIAEYYNPTPVAASYRGHENRLFKRDFAGELIDLFGLRLLDYGFVYHRDPYFPQDDLTWFLLERP